LKPQRTQRPLRKKTAKETADERRFTPINTVFSISLSLYALCEFLKTVVLARKDGHFLAFWAAGEI
jgi:hypothetical protein